ncbi:DUF3795 domain-containing protein [candidate division CSSED10-310 bacterium]|uniref:DUF3795 domain-containing protein n=1 Tax=candidate division CSSED10-310 bacterium TaxID=2855610 RepID=A0ABV6Z0G3_UNCC1
MEKMISMCGLICSECPAFLATQADDDAKRKEVAEMWSREFQADIKPANINCDGCLSDSGRVFHHATVCEIRKCGLEMGVKNCAYCQDYGCEKLVNFFNMVPAAREELDSIRSSLSL